MRKFIHNLQQILPQVHNAQLPALIFGLALLGFYLYGDISTDRSEERRVGKECL